MNMLFTYIGTQVYSNMPSMGLWGGKSSGKNTSPKNKFSEKSLKDSIRKINKKLIEINKQITKEGFKVEFLKANPNFKVSTAKASFPRVEGESLSPFILKEIIDKFESIKPQFMETSQSMTTYSKKMDIL